LEYIEIPLLERLKNMALNLKFLNTQKVDRAILVGAEVFSKDNNLPVSLSESLSELEFLAKTQNIETVARITQKLKKPNPCTFIGKGKLEELKELIKKYKVNKVIFDEELSSAQFFKLEKELKIDVLDRTQVILNIFALHARTKEAKLQVELALLNYTLPRLRRMWTHLSRQIGGAAAGVSGAVGLRGPGEKQIELDRRKIRLRISRLKRLLNEVKKDREQHRLSRKKIPLPNIAIVGYTNTGKSTLLNALTDSEIFCADMLFATLSPVIRKYYLPCGQTVVFSDTVGFIRKLPHQIISAFHATLLEVEEAELLIHVVDISDANYMNKFICATEVLKELHAHTKPTIVVCNKCDIAKVNIVSSQFKSLPYLLDVINISALKRYNITTLIQAVNKYFESKLLKKEMFVPYTNQAAISFIYKNSKILESKEKDKGILFKFQIYPAYFNRLLKLL